MRKKDLPPIEKWVASRINRVADQQHALSNRVEDVLRFRDYVPERMLCRLPAGAC
jgi:hypothetical protein